MGSKLEIPGPGVRRPAGDGPQPKETTGWRLNHTCYRIKDPAVSIPFYRDGLGLRTYFTFNTGLFTIYYLGYPPDGKDTVEVEDVGVMQQRSGLLELLHFPQNDGIPYHSGNSDPGMGFGHIGITVPSVPEALARLESFGATIVKPLGVDTDPSFPDGHEPFPEGFAKVVRKIAFVKDPDGYWIELVPIQIHS